MVSAECFPYLDFSRNNILGGITTTLQGVGIDFGSDLKSLSDATPSVQKEIQNISRITGYCNEIVSDVLLGKRRFSLYRD